MAECLNVFLRSHRVMSVRLLCTSACAKVGNADQSACAHHAEDVAGGIRGFVHNSVWLDNELAKSQEIREVLLKGAFRDAWAGKREVREIVNGVVNLEEPLCRRGNVALGGDGILDVVELSERGGGPDDVHIPCLSRNRRMAVLWSMPRPSVISLRDLRTVSARRNTSIRGSKSAALTRTASGRPLARDDERAVRLVHAVETSGKIAAIFGKRHDVLGEAGTAAGCGACLHGRSTPWVDGVGRARGVWRMGGENGIMSACEASHFVE